MSGRGQFAIDAGSKSPMGQGHYVFKTRGTQDNTIYNLLDNYVNQAIGSSQVTIKAKHSYHYKAGVKRQCLVCSAKSHALAVEVETLWSAVVDHML